MSNIQYIVKYINLYVSFYLHLSKYIDSDHLCYIYLASFTSPARSISWLSILSSISITVQACVKDLYESWHSIFRDFLFLNVFSVPQWIFPFGSNLFLVKWSSSTSRSKPEPSSWSFLRTSLIRTKFIRTRFFRTAAAATAFPTTTISGSLGLVQPWVN